MIDKLKLSASSFRSSTLEHIMSATIALTGQNSAVFSDLLHNKHLICWRLVYPIGVLPFGLDAPADAFPDGFSEYVFEFAESSPMVGQRKGFEDHEWSVDFVEQYGSTSPNPVHSVYFAVCTADGLIRHSQPSHSILYLPVLKTGEIATNPDGSQQYGEAIAADYLPTTVFADWEVDELQWFMPLSPQSRYAKAVICWCSN
jgi:hypothetical protein